MEEELDAVMKKLRKAAGLDKIPTEIWKTKKFDNILLRSCNAVYKENTIEKWMKDCILPFPKNITLESSRTTEA